MSAAKKILKIFGVVLALAVIAAVAAPFVIDVDKYRPEILRAANEQIRGSLSLGKLSLSLWGQVRVEIAGLELKGRDGKQVLAVKDAYVHVPLWSVVNGSPEVTLHLNRPEVSVARSADGVLNLVSLVPVKTDQNTEATPAKDSMVLPALLVRARLGLAMTGASIRVTDAATRSDLSFADLNFRVRDLSLDRPSSFELSTTLGAQASDSRIQGPIALRGGLTPDFSAGRFQSAKGSLTLDLTGLRVSVPSLFEKSDKVPLLLSAEVAYSPDALKIDTLKIQFQEVALTGSGTLSRAQPAQLNFAMSSGDMDLASLAKLIPLLVPTTVSGKSRLEARIDGPVSGLKYNVDLAIDQLSLTGGIAKVPVTLDAVFKVSTNKIDKFDVAVSSGKQDLKLAGSVVSFTSPVVVLSADSKSLDLDAMFNLEPSRSEAKQAAKAEPSKGGSATGASVTKEDDYDQLVFSFTKMPVIRALKLSARADLKFVRAYGIALSPVRSDLEMAGLKARLSKVEIGMFGGKVVANGAVDLTAAPPTYQFQSEVQGLDIAEAAKSQMSMFKNTLLGKLFLKLEGSGSSFVVPKAMASLGLAGNFRVENAEFSTIDIGKLVGDGLNAAIERASAQVPALKNARVQSLPAGKSEYEQVAGSFTLKGGAFVMPDFVARSRPGKGIDLEGRTEFGMVSQSIDAKWSVIDRHNLTKARDISVTIEGVEVPHVLARGDEPFSFPVTVGCKLKSPCYSYGELPGHLASVALSNIGGAAANKAKAELERRGKQLLEEQLKKGLDGLFKR